MAIKIKDKNALIKIFKTISWLDSRRWETEENYSFIDFFRDGLTNCEKILSHWICYITDRQMPFETVWEKGGYVFSELVYEYSRNGLAPLQTLSKYYEKYLDEKGEERFRFKSPHNDVTFASRYVTSDYQNILQTLEVLDDQKYKRNIVVYIIDIMQRFQEKDDLLIRVACGLYLLTYKLDRKKANLEKFIINNEEFERELKKFKKTATRGKKRLWCCIRDYKKGIYNKIFKNAIKEVAPNNAEELIEVWNKLPMDQIELPGDVWNNSPLFKDNLFANLLEIDSIPKSWEMPQIIRELYNQLKSSEEIKGFYPEQFDVTFDFVPRMCSKKMCKVCPFGKDGVELICIPSKEKYCPVALLSCGYIAICDEENCILKNGISKGICKGRIN